MTAEEIANKWVMKRFKTASQPDGHSDFEFFQLLMKDIKEHAISFGSFIDCPDVETEIFYDQFERNERRRKV